MPMTPAEYQARGEAKAERFRERAEKARAESNAQYKRSRSLTEMIPFGQPILIGHHSERRHRNAIAKSGRAMDKCVEASQKADHYERRADSAENNTAIFSDDPEAVAKLKAKIASCEKLQEIMKKANVLIRKKDIAGLTELLGADKAARLQRPDFAGRIGFASFELTNNNANINRMKKRLAELEALTVKQQQPAKEIEINGATIRENADINRIQILFAGKPEEKIRAVLKSHGFRWSPREGAWQRHLNNAGIWAAKEAVKKIGTLTEGQ